METDPFAAIQVRANGEVRVWDEPRELVYDLNGKVTVSTKSPAPPEVPAVVIQFQEKHDVDIVGSGAYSTPPGGGWVYAGAESNSETFVVGRIDAHGKRLWTTTLPAGQPRRLNQMETDAVGSVFLAGAQDHPQCPQDDPREAVVIKLDTSGRVAWIRRLPGCRQYVRELTLLADGSVIAFGVRLPEKAQEPLPPAFVAHISAQGELVSFTLMPVQVRALAVSRDRCLLSVHRPCGSKPGSCSLELRTQKLP